MVQNIDDYLNIYNNIINNFNVRNKNYYILQNINYIKEYNNTFINNINDIINDKNIINSLKNIFEMYEKIKYKEPKQPEKNISNSLKEKENMQTDEIKNDEEDNPLDIDNSFIIGYNPFEDSYETLSIKKLKKLKSFKSEHEIYGYKILRDGRILCYNKNIINIYNINRDFFCDINYNNLDCDIRQIFQMNDENLIIFYDKMIEIYEIKEKTLDKINTYSNVKNNKIFKLLDDKFLVFSDYKKEMSLYTYQNKELKVYKKFKTDFLDVYEAFEINKNEIIISYKSAKGLFTEEKICIAFYNIERNTIDNTIKIGSYNLFDVFGSTIYVNNIILVGYPKKLLLIDINTRKMKYPKYKKKIDACSNLLLLNEQKFIATSYENTNYSLVEIQSDELILKEEKKKLMHFTEYPGNKLIKDETDHTIVIYEKE